MRFFKRKPKPPLEEAIGLVYQAVEIAYAYKRDKNFRPTESDLRLFERLCEAMKSSHITTEYIARVIRQRMALFRQS